MNADVRLLLGDAERALRADDLPAARATFLEAGLCAASYQLWRAALRCYRRALEIDLSDRAAVERILQLPPRVVAQPDWAEYARALDRRAWPPFGCRAARIITGDVGARVECPGAGAVLELMMTEDDLVEVHPASRLTGMPLAMALVILRRAMWIAPRETAPDPMSLRVVFDGKPPVLLDELGDWEQVPPVGGRSPVPEKSR